ncbi:MAG: penicillin-binding protein 1C [Chitinophagales bacterium]|nr:penicillin-binding protein 1C [Chitinophagales bacterium]
MKFAYTAFKLFLSLFLLWFLFFSLPKDLFEAPKSLAMYDRHGQLLYASVADDEQWRFPKIDSVSDKLEQCVLHYEDAYFHFHPGVNPISLFKAFILNLKKGDIKRGGSTITMQTIRLLHNNPPRTYWQKLKEVFMSLKFELIYSKKDILAYYVSNAPYGGNIVGIEAAAWRYYQKPSQALSWSEAATMAVLPNQPSYIYPGKNQTFLLKKRNALLKKLRDENILSEMDYELAMDEPLPQRVFSIPSYAYHLASETGAVNGNFTTTLDLSIQKTVTDILEMYHQSFKQNLIQNLSAIVIDANTSEVLAYVGNTKDSVNGYKVNMIRRPRSSGSTLKPLLYAHMLDAGLISPNTLLQDIPIDINGYEPQNSSRRFDGLVPAHEALERSLNIPWLLALKKYGYDKFYMNLKDYNFRHFTKSSRHYGLSLVVGGGELELLELANAYLQLSHKLKGADNLIASFELGKHVEAKKDIKLSQGSIWLTFEALSHVVRPENEDNWQYRQSQKIAWKTGTSHGFRDAWAVGVNPNYVIAIWVGNADGNGRTNLTGIQKAAPILFDILNTLPKGKKSWYNKPSEALKHVLVCSESGHKPTENCKSIHLEIPQNAELKDVCPYHTKLLLDASQQYQVRRLCYSEDSIVEKTWFKLPVVEESYYQLIHPLYKSLPPFHPNCTHSELDALEIVFPKQNATIIRHASEVSNQIVFQAIHRNKEARVHWFIDNNFISTTMSEHKISWSPIKGRHKLTVQDTEGNVKMNFFTID